MKKILLLSSIIALGATTYSKEVAKPIEVVEEVMVEEVVVVEPVQQEIVVEPTYTSVDKNNLYLKAGLDVWSEYDSDSINLRDTTIKASDRDTKDLGYEIAIENTRNITDNFELGLGVAYQNHASLKVKNEAGVDYKIGTYDSVPVYVVGKYNFNIFENGITPYLKTNVGYSFNFNSEDNEVGNVSYSTKSEDGLYYGVGTGIEYNNFMVDVMYQVNQSKIKNNTNNLKNSDKKSLDYSRVTLGIGYKFSY